jgi:hypothetical protein
MIEQATTPIQRSPGLTNVDRGIEQMLTFEGTVPMTEINASDADQTQIVNLNGSSHPVRVNPGEIFHAFPLLPKVHEYLIALQKWEGCVTKVGTDTFWARLSTVVGEGPDQDAEIYIEEVDVEDQLLIQPGAVFYWTIGYLDRPSGRQRISVLRFRRLPAWTRQDLIRARSKALKLKQIFDAG